MNCISCGKDFVLEDNLLKVFCNVCQSSHDQTLRRERQLIGYLSGFRTGISNLLTSGEYTGSKEYEEGFSDGKEIWMECYQKACKKYATEL